MGDYLNDHGSGFGLPPRFSDHPTALRYSLAFLRVCSWHCIQMHILLIYHTTALLQIFPLDSTGRVLECTLILH